MEEFVIHIEDQIAILKKRGMCMDWGDEKAKEILLDIGYYHLSFYWTPFEIDDKHNIKKNTKFSNIIKLYYLDNDLKHILTKAIRRIEINFKTKLIYHTSVAYNNNSTWFADKNIVSDRFADSFPRYYTRKFKSDNTPIKKHHKTYPDAIYAPAWKTIEFLTFGSAITLYIHIRNSDIKEKIAKQYGIKSIKVFENFLLTLLFIRNSCAHNDVLFDANTPKEISTTPLLQFNQNNRHCLDSAIKVILYFIQQISNNRYNEIHKEIDTLFSTFIDNTVIKQIITRKIGYVYEDE